jgi:CubicO group peptidase (beta-lactamase class C family)
LFVLTLTAGLVSAAGHAADPSDGGRLAKIVPRMREFVDAKQISGAVTLVMHRGKVASLEAVGLADIESGRPMKPDTLFAIASMTKPITATAVMILQDDGKLSVDDPVSKYVPEFKETGLAEGKPQREVTIRDLLTHTSGLTGDQKNIGSLETTAEALARQPLAFEPGSKWQYGPGLSVAGRVVEVASGQSFETFLARRIFEPLKMVDTTFHPSAKQRERMARLYQPDNDKTGLEPGTHWLFDISPETSPNPSGGLFSTAADLGRFYQMILNEGELDGKRIVSASAVRQMTSIQTGDLSTGFTPGNGWGLGWCVVREPQGPSKMLSSGAFGHGGAFGTQGWLDPKRQTIYVLLIQRTNFGNSDGADIREVFQQLAAEALGG